MKKVFALILAFSMAFAFSVSAFAAVTPPGYRRLSDADLKTLCDGLNKDGSTTIFAYDKDLQAIVISDYFSEKTDADKSIINLIEKAENGDESAKNSVSLWATLYQKQAESYLSTLLDQGFYVDVVFRCLDPMENDAIALEYINGIRTSYRPQLQAADGADPTTDADTQPVSPAPVITDIGLEGKNYDELVALKDQINLAIWNSAEWQEVEVPAGVWRVGEDIPAGKWTVIAGNGCNQRFDIGSTLDSTGTKLAKTDYWWRLKSKDYSLFDAASDVDSVTVDLSDGMYITIDVGSVTFTPYAGKPSLGFK